MSLRKIANGQFILTCRRKCFDHQIKQRNLNQIYLLSTRNVFRSTLMKGIEIVSNDDFNIKKSEGKLPLIETKRENKPLVLLFTWMWCEPRHSDKLVDLYLKKGFDVVVASYSIPEVIFWNRGVEKKASILLDFLHQNEAFRPIIYHGFSIGNGLWTSILWHMSQNKDKHAPIVDRIKGQIWDSVTQTTNLVRNTCYVIFPNNRKMGQLLHKIVRAILSVTGHGVLDNTLSMYNRNNAIFNHPPFKIPSLLFCSKDDIYSELEGNLAAFENWKAAGIQASMKYWENSEHVRHYRLHREEYMETLDSFLRSIGVENQELEEVIAPYKIPQVQRIQIQNK
ncbi:uncharacterized protein [Halyomorpha halys]|uniref:uncharacterized protein n=1 Tax=Halyomorpha halys TaxID=286706 RepID=UPI0006D50DEB|nr:uncharacterized protein LOC106688797 [Halyomorpha halys]